MMSRSSWEVYAVSERSERQNLVDGIRSITQWPIIHQLVRQLMVIELISEEDPEEVWA